MDAGPWRRLLQSWVRRESWLASNRFGKTVQDQQSREVEWASASSSQPGSQVANAVATILNFSSGPITLEPVLFCIFLAMKNASFIFSQFRTTLALFAVLLLCFSAHGPCIQSWRHSRCQRQPAGTRDPAQSDSLCGAGSLGQRTTHGIGRHPLTTGCCPVILLAPRLVPMQSPCRAQDRPQWQGVRLVLL